MYETKMTARLGIAGKLQFRDQAGNVVKEIEIQGSIPLTDEQAQQLKEADDGADRSE